MPCLPAAGRLAGAGGRASDGPPSVTRTYWGRPVPGFGPADAALLIVGLAPAAHGGEPHRPDVHRRPQRRRALRGAARRRPGAASRRRRVAATAWNSAAPGSPRRCTARRRRTSRRPASATPARAWLTRELDAARADAAGGRRPRRVRLAGAAAGARRGRLARAPATAGVRARRARRAASRPTRRGPPAARARQLPRQPAEHVHRPADPGDAVATCSGRAADLAGLIHPDDLHPWIHAWPGDLSQVSTAASSTTPVAITSASGSRNAGWAARSRAACSATSSSTMRTGPKSMRMSRCRAGAVPW